MRKSKPTERYTREVPKRQEQLNKRESYTIFNEVQQFAYVLGAREREILLI